MENHEEKCECEICKHGKEKVMDWQQKMMEEHGWFSHFITDAPGDFCEGNAHTHGLDETYGHLDLQVVLKLDPKIVQSYFAALAEKIKAGKKFHSGQKVEEKDGLPFYLAEAEEGGRRVLRIIFPDKDGSFFEGQLKDQWKGCERALKEDVFKSIK